MQDVECLKAEEQVRYTPSSKQDSVRCRGGANGYRIVRGLFAGPGEGRGCALCVRLRGRVHCAGGGALAACGARVGAGLCGCGVGGG